MDLGLLQQDGRSFGGVGEEYQHRQDLADPEADVGQEHGRAAGPAAYVDSVESLAFVDGPDLESRDQAQLGQPFGDVLLHADPGRAAAAAVLAGDETARVDLAVGLRGDEGVHGELSAPADVHGPAAGPDVLPFRVLAHGAEIEDPAEEILEAQFQVGEERGVAEVRAHLVGKTVELSRGRKWPGAAGGPLETKSSRGQFIALSCCLHSAQRKTQIAEAVPHLLDRGERTDLGDAYRQAQVTTGHDGSPAGRLLGVADLDVLALSPAQRHLHGSRPVVLEDHVFEGAQVDESGWSAAEVKYSAPVGGLDRLFHEKQTLEKAGLA